MANKQRGFALQLCKTILGILIPPAAAIQLFAALPVREVPVDIGAQNPNVSPDGSQIAAAILGKIWVVPVSGGDARQMTDGIGWDTHPAWSPDGRFLAYSHHLASGTDLVVLNIATRNSSFLYHTDAEIGEIEYAPDGSGIFFVLKRGQYDAHVQKISPGGGEAQPITSTEEWHEWAFALSPDGKDLVTASGHYGGANLYRIHLDGKTATRLTHTEADQTSVAWTRDGKSFIYIETLNGTETVFAQPTAGGDRRAVYSSPYRDTELALEPEGEVAVLAAARRLWELNLATGQVKPIPFRARFAGQEQSSASLVITHARLIDGTSRGPIEDATIEIRNGRFASVRSGKDSAPSPGARVIDAKGKSVLPGLMDNHYHYWDIFDGSRLLAHGITSIRDPGVDLSDGLNFKQAISHGLAAGPDIYTAGPLIDGINDYHPMVTVEIDDPSKAAVLVDSLKEQGVDLLKVYFMLKPEVLCSVIKAAHKDGLKATGHIGVHTSWGQALDCGIDGLNHIRTWADFLPLSEQPQGENLSLDARIHPVARMQSDWSKIDPNGPEAGNLIEKMVKDKVGFDPTLSIQKIDDSERKGLNLEEFTKARNAYQKMGAFVARAQKAGVLLLAGTDDGSLFDEMEAYEQAGVPRLAVIQAATRNGAEWLGKEGDFGSITPGLRADLIIVDGDPLAGIKNIRNIRTVIKDGEVVFEENK